ncbi:MAG: hypothetical protein JNM95_12465 [Chitinophagaceae bacterium]|nr:hypothetical protein [Chitinophagaceae bacterium]
MVTEAQFKSLLDECQQWIDNLAQQKEKLNGLRNELYLFAPGKTDHDVQVGIEHYHNQFHIQQINIHDLKHEIRYHLAEAKHHPDFGHRIPHHNLLLKYDTLMKDLQTLDQDFHHFIKNNA